MATVVLIKRMWLILHKYNAEVLDDVRVEDFKLFVLLKMSCVFICNFTIEMAP